MPASEFGPYRGEALYIPEEDTHYPGLTLKETLTFALRTKTPGNRFSGETRRRFRQRVYDSLVKMFGLVNQSYTVIYFSIIFLYYGSYSDSLRFV